MRLLTLLAIGIVSVNSLGHIIPDDVVPNYGRVKELLHQSFYDEIGLPGHSHDPISPEQIASQIKDDGTEIYPNREILTEVFEGDIVLSAEQAEVILNPKTPFGRGKRQLTTEENLFWKQLTIPFKFDEGEHRIKDQRYRQLIREVLRYLETELCFRFQENGSGDGINFIDRGGCWSNLGRIGGWQTLSISYGCDHFAIVAHEVLHSLGVWHEMSRSDRDNYIRIEKKWVKKGFAHAFLRRTQVTNLDNPYDFGSVMFYGSKAFTTDWKHNTIVTKDPNYQNTIGQRVKISFKDGKLVNDRYCKNICRVKLPCVNYGYTDPNNCNRCKCPSGYAGRLCEQLEKTSCGGELVANGQWQTLQSNVIKANDNCVWRIKAKTGQKIEAVFDRMHFPCPDEHCVSYVEYKYHKSKAEAGARLCCKPPASPIISEGDEVLVFLTGDKRLSPGYTGFSLRYRTIGKPVTEAPITKKTTTPFPTTRPTTRVITTKLTTTTTTTPRPRKPMSKTTVEPKTTKRVTTTTLRPTTAQPKGSSGCWGTWGAWSQCSKPCGGCGTQKRVRTCNRGDNKCQGPSTQTQSCNLQVCKKSTKTCKGRLLIPCDLLPKLRFMEKPIAPPSPSRWNDQVKREIASSLRGTQFYRSPISRDRFRRRFKRQLEHPMCEKTFSYSCPTELLTINIDWRTALLSNDAINMDNDNDVMQCCVGYKASGGNCYKI